MDLNDVCNIEFLDLSDVEESEQIRVRTSLQHNDPSVQLPWLKPQKKKLIEDKERQRKSPVLQNDLHIPPQVTHNDYIHPMVSPPLVNNIYHNPPHVVVPQIIPHPGYVLQSNVVCYSSPPIQSTYPQQIFIPPNAVHTFPHTAAYYPMTPTQPKRQISAVLPVQLVQQNGTGHSPPLKNEVVSAQVHSEPVYNEDVSNDLVIDAKEDSGDDVNIEDSTISSLEIVNKTDVEDCQQNETATLFDIAPMNVANMPSNENSPVDKIADSNTLSDVTIVTPDLPVNSPVIQNGIGSSPAPVNKSWASLFSTKTTDGGNSSCVSEIKTTKEQVSNEKNNNVPLCPIKHPRKSAQFIDPDCYRMGEFLNSHIIDGKAISLQPRGLLNQSNYCYINSILQALIACPPLYNLLSGLSQNISSNEKRKPTPVIDGMCRFVKEFKHLPANLRVNNRRSDGKTLRKDIMINTDIPFEPSWVYKMLNGIQTDLIEGRQEDAEEFLGCLLNGLNDEMLELIKLVKNESGENEEMVNKESDSEDKEWQVMGPKNKGSVTRRTDFGRTPISDIFGGLLKSRVHRTGDHITENIQPFFTLQLNIEKVKSVREALEALVTKYQLEGLTSSKTNEEVEAWQQVMLDELPIILILHLKCFDFKLDGCTKIVKALEFPVDLKIEAKLLSSKIQSVKEKQYKLFAVVYHDGKEATKGHYVTDAFHVGYSCWLRYDDASVKTVQEENVLKPQGTRVPYLLFYRRCDTIRSK